MKWDKITLDADTEQRPIASEIKTVADLAASVFVQTRESSKIDWSMGFQVARIHGGSAMHLQKRVQEHVTAMQ
jgi:hypothetical protein